MNRRIKKKLNKRDGIKSYSEWKEHRFIKAIQNMYGTTNEDIIYLQKSKSGKSNQKIFILRNCYPVAVDTMKPNIKLPKITFTY